MTIGIISVGLGNVGSIQRMLKRVGVDSHRISTPQECMEAHSLILPGVGHFDEGMRLLRQANLVDVIIERVCEGKIPILGICLGMQLLCRSSEEGLSRGLGLIDADVKKLRFPHGANHKVPHMGWNALKIEKNNPLIMQTTTEQRFYFVHSYHVLPHNSSIVIGSSEYGIRFCSAFQQGNTYGVQFHPEKSHRFGMSLMKHFAEL